MKPYQFVGYTLNQTTAVTAITSTRIYHGDLPNVTTLSAMLPCINYYELSNVVRRGTESQSYSINCRAATPAGARDLARAVVDLFNGTSGTGIYGTMNGFSIGRASLRQDQGLLSEPDGGVYNAPVDVLLVYTSDTVS
jgi:hypothetical protein